MQNTNKLTEKQQQILKKVTDNSYDVSSKGIDAADAAVLGLAVYIFTEDSPTFYILMRKIKGQAITNALKHFTKDENAVNWLVFELFLNENLTEKHLSYLLQSLTEKSLSKYWEYAGEVPKVHEKYYDRFVTRLVEIGHKDWVGFYLDEPFRIRMMLETIKDVSELKTSEGVKVRKDRIRIFDTKIEYGEKLVKFYNLVYYMGVLQKFGLESDLKNSVHSSRLFDIK